MILEIPPVTELGDGWSELFFIPYGDENHQLGTSTGGDAGQLEIGPDYGAQAADGSWWFLDAANRRLAHYSQEGDYLDQVVLASEFLVEGQYWPYQLPHILDDGTLVASWLDPETSKLLLLVDLELSLVEVDGMFSPIYSDGHSLFGFSQFGDLLRVDPHSGESETVDWFLTPAGTRFRLLARDDRLTIELPDAPEPVVISINTVLAGDPSERVIAGIEEVTGEDGTLFVYMYGSTFMGGGPQLGGFLTVTPDGQISELEPTRDPFSRADPGSPAHLGVRPGTSTPWLVFVDTDGVRVYVRPDASD